MHLFGFTTIYFREISYHTLCHATSEVHHKDITFKTTSKAANKRPTDEVDDDLWQRMLRVNSTRKSDLKVNFCTPLSWTKEGKTWMYTWKKWPSAFFRKKEPRGIQRGMQNTFCIRPRGNKITSAVPAVITIRIWRSGKFIQGIDDSVRRSSLSWQTKTRSIIISSLCIIMHNSSKRPPE